MNVHGWLWSAPAVSCLCQRVPQSFGARSGPELAGRPSASWPSAALLSSLCRVGVENRSIHSPKAGPSVIHRFRIARTIQAGVPILTS